MTTLVVALVAHVPSAAAQASTAFWSADVGAHGSWFDNPRNAAIVGQPGYVAGLGVGLGYTMVSPRSQVEFIARTAAVVREGTSGKNRFNYLGGLNLSRHATPRLTLKLSDDLSSRYTSGSPYLAADGLIYPVTLIRQNNLSGGLAYELSTRTSVSVTARHDWVGFDETSGLKNGWQLGAAVSLDRRLTPASTVSLSYSYRHSRYETPSHKNTDTHNVTAGWGRQLSQRFALSAAAGVSHISRLDGGSKVGWVGGAAVTEKFQTGSLSLHYSHGLSQAYGYSRDQVHDVVGLDYSRSLARNLSASLAGTYARGRDPYDPTWGSDAQRYSADIQYAVSRGWTSGAGYAWLYRRHVDTSTWSTSEIHASMRYGWQWR